ncbi:MAG TPA: hypothetical protein VKB28_16210 [Solirubrobacteraceae bacterium]|nr:hypothetical protein [Solirubrobacteraceae bacterium]
MARTKRANGAGTVYIKNGSYYGRWVTLEGGRTNRKLGRVRKPGTRDGLTHTQAEKRLRELIQIVQVTSDPDRTMATAGQALLARLEAKGSSKSHVETAESHLRGVHWDAGTDRRGQSHFDVPLDPARLGVLPRTGVAGYRDATEGSHRVVPRRHHLLVALDRRSGYGAHTARDRRCLTPDRHTGAHYDTGTCSPACRVAGPL